MRSFLCRWLGCCSEYEEQIEKLAAEYDKALDRIDQLENLLPRPAPPEIDSISQKDSLWIRSVIDGLNLGLVWLQLDNTYYLTNQTNFLNIVAWDWVDSYEYRRDVWDCDKYAFRFKSQVDLHFNLNMVGVVIDYKSGHAYNLVIFTDGKVMLLEPQSDSLFCWTQRLETFYSLKGAILLS